MNSDTAAPSGRSPERMPSRNACGTAVVTLARAGCNEVEIYSITGHKPSDVRAILTAHYLPRDAEIASNAIAKLNRYKAREDHKRDEKLPTALPTALKIGTAKTEKA